MLCFLSQPYVIHLTSVASEISFKHGFSISSAYPALVSVHALIQVFIFSKLFICLLLGNRAIQSLAIRHICNAYIWLGNRRIIPEWCRSHTSLCFPIINILCHWIIILYTSNTKDIITVECSKSVWYTVPSHFMICSSLSLATCSVLEGFLSWKGLLLEWFLIFVYLLFKIN